MHPDGRSVRDEQQERGAGITDGGLPITANWETNKPCQARLDCAA